MGENNRVSTPPSQIIRLSLERNSSSRINQAFFCLPQVLSPCSTLHVNGPHCIFSKFLSVNQYEPLSSELIEVHPARGIVHLCLAIKRPFPGCAIIS